MALIPFAFVLPRMPFPLAKELQVPLYFKVLIFLVNTVCSDTPRFPS